MKSSSQPSGLARISRRDRFLLLTLAVLAAAWAISLPWRARIARETARIEQDTTRKAAEVERLEKLQAAEATSRQRVSAEPRSVEARLALAAALGQQKKYPEAVRELRTAQALAPSNPEPHVALGQIFDVSGLSDLAVEEYRKALERAPDHAQALTNLAYKYVAFGWNQQAERLLLRALKVLPNDVRLNVTMGLVYFQVNNTASAERYLLRARKLAPDDPTILGPLIEVYRHGQRPAEALKVLDEALPRLPNNKEALTLQRAQIFLDMQKPEEAITEANRVLPAKPDHMQALYLRAVARKMQGKKEEAIQDFERVRALDSRFDQTLMHLGQLYAQTGQTEKGKQLLAEYDQNRAASEMLSRLTLHVASKPNDANAHRELGRYYQRGGSLARAIVEFKRVLELKPGDKETRRLLALALKDAGRSAEATALLAGTPTTPMSGETSETIKTNSNP
jgi:protein O-GlcNAc transferase